ncbi:MAG: hypothetical protein IIW20_04660, partial [Clostridia bacterium]|nr:hypothetical protein [Clostridia bacterium]
MEKEISGKKRLVSFLHSDTFKVILCLFALLFVILDQAVLGTLIFVVITSLLLLPWGDGAAALLSFLLVCGISMRCYDSFDTFIVFWPLALLPIAVLIARLILGIRELKNKDSQRVGESFYPNLAVAISVTLGGLGSISLSDYFSPTALYYVFFLGFGMIVFYLVARVEIFKAKEEIFDAFA